MKMNNFYIITNSEKDRDLLMTDKIVSYLKKHGMNCQVQHALQKQDAKKSVRRELCVKKVRISK